MGKNSEIGWLHRILPSGVIIPGNSFNPWWGCFKVAQGCKNCYAEGIAVRYKKPVWGPASTTDRWLFGEKHWQEPLKWNREAEQLGHRMSVFCASMADVFEDHPLLPEERAKLWPLIEQTPWLNWLLLTKRPQNILEMVPWGESFPDNVWCGTSVACQKDALVNIPHLLRVPSVVRFLSVEPQLELVNLTPWLHALQWIICGGESGPHARPFDLAWARSLRDQCRAARLTGHDVRYFFKQVGGRTHSAGGRDLDKRTWDQMPEEIAPRTPVRVTPIATMQQARKLERVGIPLYCHYPGIPRAQIESLRFVQGGFHAQVEHASEWVTPYSVWGEEQRERVSSAPTLWDAVL